MPGIVAALDFEARPDLPERIRRQMAATTGPSCRLTDLWLDADGVVGLGRADLGIFNSASQPIVSADQRFRLFFVGELLEPSNRLRELRAHGIALSGQDHADLLLGTYLVDGLDGVARLNGSYFFALWDQVEKQLVVGGDRYGTRPHFYTFWQGRLLVAPDLKGILAGRGDVPSFAMQGIFEFLAFEHPLADRTFFEGVQVFPGGTLLVLSQHKTMWRPYWSVRYRGLDEVAPRSRTQWLEQAVCLYRQAVKRTMDGPVCVPLSGGIDSRLILALAPRLEFPVFTMGEEGSQDVVYARQIAQILGVRHVVQPLPNDYLASQAKATLTLGDGMSSLFHAHNSVPTGQAPILIHGMYAEFSRINQAEGVLLNPASTPVERAWQLLIQALTGRMPLVQPTDEAALVRHLLQATWGVVTRELSQEVLLPDVARAFQEAVVHGVAAQMAAISGPSLVDRLMAYNLLHRQRRFTQWGLKQEGHWSEIRRPLCDYDLVDFLLTVPSAIRRNLQVDLICHLHPRLAAVPRTPSGVALNAGRLPRAIAYARLLSTKTRKHGRRQSFADPGVQIRTHARGFFEELLLDRQTLQNGWYQPEGIQALLKRHMQGIANEAPAICALATLELWRRSDGGGQPSRFHQWKTPLSGG